MNLEEQAQERAKCIIRVNAGMMTATDAAKDLNVSRKTYYTWEAKGLEGMLGALLNRCSGRPGEEVDGEKEQLRRELREAQDRIALLEGRLELKKELAAEIELNKKKERDSRKSARSGGKPEKEAEGSVPGALHPADNVVLDAHEAKGKAEQQRGAGSEAGSEEVRGS